MGSARCARPRHTARPSHRWFEAGTPRDVFARILGHTAANHQGVAALLLLLTHEATAAPGVTACYWPVLWVVRGCLESHHDSLHHRLWVVLMPRPAHHRRCYACYAFCIDMDASLSVALRGSSCRRRRPAVGAVFVRISLCTGTATALSPHRALSLLQLRRATKQPV
jgi:hypothetical protein